MNAWRQWWWWRWRVHLQNMSPSCRRLAGRPHTGAPKMLHITTMATITPPHNDYCWYWNLDWVCNWHTSILGPVFPLFSFLILVSQTVSVWVAASVGLMLYQYDMCVSITTPTATSAVSMHCLMHVYSVRVRLLLHIEVLFIKENRKNNSLVQCCISTRLWTSKYSTIQSCEEKFCWSFYILSRSTSDRSPHLNLDTQNNN